MVKFQLHRFPLNDYLELNIFPLPLFRRKEMDIHSALIRARCGSGGPHWACFKPAGTSPCQQTACSCPSQDLCSGRSVVAGSALPAFPHILQFSVWGVTTSGRPPPHPSLYRQLPRPLPTLCLNLGLSFTL